MSRSWDEKIAAAKRGIKRSERALVKYRDQLDSAVAFTSRCRTSNSKRNNANRKNSLRKLIDRSRNKINKHKKAIRYYKGRKSGSIPPPNIFPMSKYTR